MPVVPPIAGNLPSTVFWSAFDVLNFARMLTNDMQGSQAGQELAIENPYTWVLLNFCYAKLCNQIEDTNVESVTYAEAIVGPIPAAPTAAFDPNVQVRLGYDGVWNGSPDSETDGSIILPGDMLEPTIIMERPSGSNLPFLQMKQQMGGLRPKWGSAYGYSNGYSRLGTWEFRGGNGAPCLYFPGAQIDIDIRIRYIPSLPLLELTQDDDENYIYPQIPLARAGEALAYGVAYQWQMIRGAANALALKAEYDNQIRILSNKSAKRANATISRSRGYGFSRSNRRWWI